MKLKKILSICLVGALAATMLAACGSSDETVGEEIKDDAEEVAEDVKDVAEDVGEGVEDAVEDVGEDIKDAAEEAVDDVKENASGDEDGDYSVSFEGFDNTITITGYGMTLFTSDGLEEVVEAVNEISVPEINVELEYGVMDLSSYSEQIGLMFSGGESFDLMMIVPVNAIMYSTLLANNELMDISGYVDEYAPETMELLSDYINPFKLDGALYGLPVYRIYNSDMYIIMRQDILDELGLTEQAEAVSSWSDLEAIFEAVYEAQDELPEEMQTPAIISNSGARGEITAYPNGYNITSDDFSGHYGYDTLGDSNATIAVIDGVVTNAYDTEDYLTVVNRVREWYQKGWVYKDAASNMDNGDTSITNGVSFCVIETSEVGVEAAKKQATGYDVVCVNCCPQVIQSSTATTWAWGVPVTANEPEAAIAFLNLMYTDPRIENLFVYGIEGRDYYVNDEGEAVFYEDNVYQSSDWLYPNQFNAYPSEGQGGDFREYALEVMNEGGISEYYGFSVNTDPIANELMTLSNVLDQYAPGLNSGSIDASDTYDDFMVALENGGIQTVIDFYQNALDEWLATQ